MTKVIGIHQPNFLPWMPYFSKLEASDAFVLLDDVQFPQGSYVNRVRGPEPLHWMTVPVRHGSALIKDTLIDYGRNWHGKLLRGIQQIYGKAPFFEETFGPLQRFVGSRPRFLIELNLPLITWLRDQLGLQTSLHLSSQFGLQTSGSERLVEICQALQASHYLAGKGSIAYEKLELYAQAGIHYVSADLGRGQSPLSILDSLMKSGASATAGLIRERRWQMVEAAECPRP
ncbi:MAG: WbqC family protein [Vulcanimicrobiota bacterium]